MKTRTQRLTTLADRLDATRASNRMEWAHLTCTSIVQQVKDDLDMDFACFREADPPMEEHYLAGLNFHRGKVMYAITGDEDWLPVERCDPHITF